jgi:hypothetical protein
VARQHRKSVPFDATWDYDHLGILHRRGPSGEVEVFVPHALRREGPCAIIYPLAEDGSVLREGVIRVPERQFARPTRTLLTRDKIYPKSTNKTARHGLAILLEEDRTVIPTGNERDVAALSTDELRTAQAEDETCQRLLTQATKSVIYDLDQDGLLVRISPSDGSRQIVIPQELISRVLYL